MRLSTACFAEKFWNHFSPSLSLSLSLSHTHTHTLSLSFSAILNHSQLVKISSLAVASRWTSKNTWMKKNSSSPKLLFQTSAILASSCSLILSNNIFCLFWPDATKDGCLLLANGKNIDNVLVFVFVWAWVSDTLCRRVIVFALDLFSCRWPEQWWQLLGSCVDLRRRRLWVLIHFVPIFSSRSVFASKSCAN